MINHSVYNWVPITWLGHDGGDGGDHGPSTMSQPGVPLRRRTKGPALSRPMVSDPLVPPSEPKAHVDDHVGEGGEPTKEHQVPNPHEQLQLVVTWH